jgi:hypothetical protein
MQVTGGLGEKSGKSASSLRPIELSTTGGKTHDPVTISRQVRRFRWDDHGYG